MRAGDRRSTRTPLSLGLVALAPLLLWMISPMLAFAWGGLPEPDAVEQLFALFFLAMYLGIGLTCLFVPTIVGVVGLALAVSDMRLRGTRIALVALALNAVAVVFGTWVAIDVWRGS